PGLRRRNVVLARIRVGIAPAIVLRMAVAQEPAKVGDLLKSIGDDVKTIALGELELARQKLGSYLELTVMKAAAMILGTFVALVGFAMLCVVVVVVLEPVIPALWLRLLVMAVAYLAVGGGATYMFAKKMIKAPDLDHEVDEVGQTIDKVADGLKH
ncbi:MAG TPA: phage holin family protein, partial [Kofleriaceae bacterium]|nr:phage holin family protein [Kofleriaceae bacterium]